MGHSKYNGLICIFLKSPMMACHTRRFLTVCLIEGQWKHAILDVVYPFMLFKGDDDIPHPTSFDRVCCLRDMRACQDRRCLTVCAVQKQWWHATPNVIRPYVLSKGDDCMPRPMSSDCVFFPSAMIACHARRHPTVCSAQGGWWNYKSDVIRSYVLSKGDDNMPRPTSSGRVYCLRAMMTCHTLRRLTFLLSNDDDAIPRPMSFISVCCPKAMMAWNARRYSTMCVVQERDGMQRPM